MEINLSPEQVRLIEAELAQGRSSSPEEVITKALQVLARRREEYLEWVEEVREKVGEAEASLSRGERLPLEVVAENLQEKFRRAREAQG